MKKFISAVAAAILTVSSAIPCFAGAEDYIPTVYMKLQDTDAVTFDEDGTIVINRSKLQNDLTLTADVYIQDDSLTSWYVSPHWKSENNFIVLSKVYDPLESPLLPYAYAETNENGELIIGRHSTAATINPQFNVINFTCQRQRTMTDASPLAPYGEKSDDYPLVSFDMTVSKNTPYGESKVYFLTEAVDFSDQRYTQVAMRVDGSTICIPHTHDLRIRVEGANLGDVNNDGYIDSSDASDVLIAYANVSTGKEHGFSAEQVFAANITNDNMIDSSDASCILQYYSYTSTTEAPVSFSEFMKK